MTRKVGVYREPRNKRKPWSARWYGEHDPATGKPRRYTKAFALKRDAEAFAAEKAVEFDGGGRRDRPREITVSEFVERFMETRMRNRRPSTRYNYRHTLEQLTAFVGAERPLCQITPELAERFSATRVRVAKGGNGLRKASRNRHMGNAKTAMRAAVEWGYIPANPFAGCRKEKATPRKWHHLTPPEFQALLAAAPDARWRRFYLLAYTTGARFGELFNLTWADIDFDGCTIIVRDGPETAATPPFTVKDCEARTLLIPAETVEALTAWQSEAPEGVPYVLLSAARWDRVRELWRLCRAGEL